MVYSYNQSEQDKNNQKDTAKKAMGTKTMRNLEPIKLVERSANTALDALSNDQLVHISELALEHF